MFFGKIFLCTYNWDTGVSSFLPSYCNLTFTVGREYIKLRRKKLGTKNKNSDNKFLFKEFNPTQAIPDQTRTCHPYLIPFHNGLSCRMGHGMKL